MKSPRPEPGGEEPRRAGEKGPAVPQAQAKDWKILEHYVDSPRGRKRGVKAVGSAGRGRVVEPKRNECDATRQNQGDGEA